MVKINNRKCASDNLKKYDYLCKDEDFIEVTEWTNGEGITIDLNEKLFHLTYGELDAINYLCNALRYESNNK